MVQDNPNISAQKNAGLLKKELLGFNTVAAESLLNKFKQEMSPIALVEHVIVPALTEIGKGWEKGTIALSQIYLSGILIEKFVGSLFPAEKQGYKGGSRIAIAVLDDFHFLGKRIVYSFLKSSGYELADYGHVTARELVERVQKDKIDLLLISVLMLPAAIKVRTVKQNLLKAGSNTKIVVGGAPFRLDVNLWRDVGADDMGANAGDALSIVERLGHWDK